MQPHHDIRHLGRLELLTPKPERTLWYFRDVLGMEVVHQQGGSAWLRGYGDHAAATRRASASSLAARHDTQPMPGAADSVILRVAAA